MKTSFLATALVDVVEITEDQAWDDQFVYDIKRFDTKEEAAKHIDKDIHQEGKIEVQEHKDYKDDLGGFSRWETFETIFGYELDKPLIQH